MPDGRISLPTTRAEYSQIMLDDIELEARNLGLTDPPVQPGTDWWLLAQSVGTIALMAGGKIAAAESDASVLTATGAQLDQIRIADGLPEVQPRGSVGRIKITCSGVRSVLAGTKFAIGSLQYQVVGNWLGITTGTEIDGAAISTGTATNQAGGTEASFATAPMGVQQKSTVSYAQPFRGGTDAESDSSKRDRILNRRRYAPGAGNPGHLRQIATNTIPNLGGAFVYCAPGGPGSDLTAICKAIDPDSNDFSRQTDDATTALVRAAIQSQLPDADTHVVRSVADELVDVSLQVTIPASALAGGDGSGWTDAAPWPSLSGDTVCPVSTVTSTRRITVDANTTTAPIAGLTNIAWWAPGDQQFRMYLVVTVTSSAPSAHDITLDRPMVDSDGNPVAPGDYICPASSNLLNYGNTWRAIIGTLGPGEITADANRIPRAARIPLITDGPQSDLNAQLRNDMTHAHTEMADCQYAYRSKSAATVPASVDSAPNVLRLHHFGIYPL